MLGFIKQEASKRQLHPAASLLALMPGESYLVLCEVHSLALFVKRL